MTDDEIQAMKAENARIKSFELLLRHEPWRRCLHATDAN
jgi:hypothetical protein